MRALVSAAAVAVCLVASCDAKLTAKPRTKTAAGQNSCAQHMNDGAEAILIQPTGCDAFSIGRNRVSGARDRFCCTAENAAFQFLPDSPQGTRYTAKYYEYDGTCRTNEPLEPIVTLRGGDTLGFCAVIEGPDCSGNIFVTTGDPIIKVAKTGCDGGDDQEG